MEAMTAYPVANKRKSWDICAAWIKGCGGQIGTNLRDGAAFFYGVDESNLQVWREVVQRGSPYYYCDNSYFDQTRQSYFRVTKNRLQHAGLGQSSGERFARLGIQIEPWRSGGSTIVLCPQSAHFMKNVVGAGKDWVDETLEALKSITPLAVKVRPWKADKAKLASTLHDDLVDARAVVTWSSAAAVTALLDGVPVVTLGQCAAEPLAGPLHQVESLPRPAGRLTWASVLADNQWTLDEMRTGVAWRHLNE